MYYINSRLNTDIKNLYKATAMVNKIAIGTDPAMSHTHYNQLISITGTNVKNN